MAQGLLTQQDGTTPTPGEHTLYVHILDEDGNESPLASHQFSIDSMPTLTVIKSGNGTVTSAQAGIDCGADCTEDYISGTSITLSATPDTGWTFSGWSGGGCSGTGDCVTAMNQDTPVTASFTTTATQWSIESLQNVGAYGGYTSVVTDSSGNTHISYHKKYWAGRILYGLYYATNSGGTWSYSYIDSSSSVLGQYTSIAIDSNDKLHISYIDGGSKKLKYATNTSGNWSRDNITFALNGYTSIAVDSSDKLHISYFDGGLKYVTNSSGSWVITNIDSGAGDYSSISLDSNDNVHISYNDNGKLRYATNASGSWVNEIVDNTGGMYTSIGVDSSDNVHISHTDHVYFDLEYATNKDVATGSGNCYTGSNWDCSVIDGSFGDHSSLSIDSYGNIHVSYYDGNLKYATDASGLWVTETVDNSGDVGEYTSITIDSSDKAHISYFANTGDRIKHAVTNAPIAAQYTLNVIRAGTGSGTITSAPAGINCGADCSETYGKDTVITLTASPDTISTFTGWSGGGCTGTGACQVIMDSSKAVTAVFSVNEHSISPTAGPNGIISPSTVQATTYGNTAAFTITPVTGYHISSVTGTCGGTLLNNTYITNAVTADCTITADFAINTYAVIPPAAINGSVNPSAVQTVNHGETVSFTLVPDQSYQLNVGSTCGGGLSGNTYTTNPVTSDCNVEATFATAFHTVTPSAGLHGIIDPATPQTVGEGYSAIFTVTPEDGYTATVTGTCGGTLEENRFITNAITTDCTVDASFNLNNPPSADTGGPYTEIEGQIITLNGSGSSDSDGTITLYEWDIDNDGTYDYNSSSPTQSHIYAQQGVYTIKLRVTDYPGAIGEATTTATISDTSPTADFTGSPTSGTAPLIVNFTDSSTGHDQPLTYEWDFDYDSIIDSMEQNPSYTYTNSGIYTAKLTATDSDGSTNSLTRTDYITVCNPDYIKKIGATTDYYTTISDAYNAADDGDTIQIQTIDFIGDLDFYRNIFITLSGGYECDFSSVTGETTINGNLSINDGIVIMENIHIQ